MSRPVPMPGIFSDYYPKEFRDYAAQYNNQLEKIGWKWWDTQTYVSGTTTSLPQWFNVRATPDLSNMEVAFQLAAPKAFLIRAIRMYYKTRPISITVTGGNAATGAFDDVVQLINGGTMNLTIGQKQYDIEPLWVLNAGGGAMGNMAVAGSTTGTGLNMVSYAQNGIPDARAVNTLSVPIFIPPQLNFSAVLSWPTALTLAGGNTSVQLLLDGDLVRPVQ